MFRVGLLASIFIESRLADLHVYFVRCGTWLGFGGYNTHAHSAVSLSRDRMIADYGTRMSNHAQLIQHWLT